jgi:hypothetical protein
VKKSLKSLKSTTLYAPRGLMIKLTCCFTDVPKRHTVTNYLVPQYDKTRTSSIPLPQRDKEVASFYSGATCSSKLTD